VLVFAKNDNINIKAFGAVLKNVGITDRSARKIRSRGLGHRSPLLVEQGPCLAVVVEESLIL